MTKFKKTAIRAEVLEALYNRTVEYKEYYVSFTEDDNGNKIPYDEEEAVKAEVIDEVLKLLEKAL